MMVVASLISDFAIEELFLFVCQDSEFAEIRLPGLPSGNDSDSELENHHVINGKTHAISMAMAELLVFTRDYVQLYPKFPTGKRDHRNQ